jgi:ankyrin repeat protein
VQRDHNSTPLSLAMRNRNRPMVIVLLSRGTAHGAKRAGVDFVTNPVLHVAALNDDAAEVARLLDRGTPPDARSKARAARLLPAALAGTRARLPVSQTDG